MAAKIFWITGPWRGRLAIVPRPRGAEWLDDEIRAWREAGIDVVVSLLGRDEEVDLDLTGESSSSKASGLVFRAFPIPDRSVPRSRAAVTALAEEIVDALRSGKTVAVHCRQGIGRSAMIVAAALIASGLTPESAVNAIRQSRGLEVPETEAQRQWISDFAVWLSRRHAAQQQHAADVAPRRT
ncbi:MAG: dual specificity protein phosphatase family protein [Betaproteobacteria bacterium]|nr:dual specificity protein phosphatase family protein [Betaproteobacteria bacterium]MBI2961312.1 dual specificity protein phosphatase family protein [Betaproteobacteria bacterium]